MGVERERESGKENQFVEIMYKEIHRVNFSSTVEASHTHTLSLATHTMERIMMGLGVMKMWMNQESSEN